MRRVRSLAPVVAALTLAWLPLDPWVLDWRLAFSLVPVRLAMAVALVVLGRRGRATATAAVRTLIAIQAIGFGWIGWLVQPLHGVGLQVGYSIFPFALVAQLSAFPLPWTATLRIAATPAVLVLALLLGHPGPLGRAEWHDLWLFLLVTGLAAWSSQVQLRLLLDLLGARRDASVDPLTGLANRRAAWRRLELELARAQRYGEPLSVLMLDLDHFKRVNDSWGHATGDRLLTAVAHALDEELRSVDLACRHGGEEFLAILPATSTEQAEEVAERIRARIAALRIEVPQASVSVTVSVGLASWLPGESPSALIGRADRALYRAKAEGRNRLCLAESPITPG